MIFDFFGKFLIFWFILKICDFWAFLTFLKNFENFRFLVIFRRKIFSPKFHLRQHKKIFFYFDFEYQFKSKIKGVGLKSDFSLLIFIEVLWSPQKNFRQKKVIFSKIFGKIFDDRKMHPETGLWGFSKKSCRGVFGGVEHVFRI